MIKANSKRFKAFINKTVATLQTLLKLRLATEPSRLPVRVIEHKNGQYKLQCQYSRLTGQYQGRELNHVNATVGNAISTNIQSKPNQNRASKDVTITLLKAVAKANNCSSITAAQKAS